MTNRIRYRLTLLAVILMLCGTMPVQAESVAFVVPAAVIYPGQQIGDEGLLEKSFTINPEAADQYVLSPRQAIGKVTKRTLLPGKPILMSALAEPFLVKRGVPAPLIFTAGSLTITAMGTPLESGSVGDFIKVRNADSGLIVSGTVLADGNIQVGMQ